MWSITAKRLSWLSAFDFSLNGSLPIATYFLAAHAQVDATTAFGPNGEIIDEFNPASTFDWLDKNKNSTDDSDDWTMAKKLPLSHCFRGGSTTANKDECFERGTLLLKPNSARIEDTPKFEEMRDGGSLKSLIEGCGFYSIKLKNTVEGTSSSKNAGKAGEPTYELLTSIPCSLLKIEDSHDSLEISLTPHGQVVSINYRTQPAWGLNLFEHTAVLTYIFCLLQYNTFSSLRCYLCSSLALPY